MIPFFIYTLIATMVAFAGGFWVGKKQGNHQSAPRFGDLPNSSRAKEMGEKGRKIVEARIEKRKARIMERAKREGKVTNDDVEDLFCISDATARNYLNELEAEGLLTQHGESGRGVHYTLKN